MQPPFWLIIASLLLAIPLQAHADATAFTKQVDSCFYPSGSSGHFALNIPSGFTEAPVITNQDQGYEYAITNADRSIEIRYGLDCIKKDVADYADWQAAKQKGDEQGQTVKLDPNTYWNSMLQVALFNLAGGSEQVSDPTPFPDDAVQSEFGADAGATFSIINPQSEFGKGFGALIVYTLHRKDQGDVSVFMLFQTKKPPTIIWKPCFIRLSSRTSKPFNLG